MITDESISRGKRYKNDRTTDLNKLRRDRLLLLFEGTVVREIKKEEDQRNELRQYEKTK